MRIRLALVVLLAALLGALAAVWAIERELARTWLAVGVHPEVIEALGEAMRTQRQIADLDPAASDQARERFARLERLQARLRVVALGQDQLVRRAQWTLLATVLALLATAGALWLTATRHTDRRLERLRIHLAALAGGATEVATGERHHDALGRVAAMVEQTARVVGRERQQAAALTHLAQWQEAARRQVHELRTPLTGGMLELERLRDLLLGTPPSFSAVAAARLDALAAELERLRRFTAEFAGFARLREPRPEPTDLAALLAELVRTFAGAWPGMELVVATDANDATDANAAPREPSPSLLVVLDRELIRQLVVNLLDNAGRAGARRLELRLRAVAATPGSGRSWRDLPRPAAGSAGEVVVEIRDDGPGLPEGIRARLFEPYNTSRKSGEGLGLGLAIARKIALDHHGDLELAESGAASTIFRLRLPFDPATGAGAPWVSAAPAPPVPAVGPA